MVDILMIVLIGTLCGYKSIEEIHFNAELSEEELKKYLNLPSGIPSTDTILRVLAGTDRKQMEKIVAKYAKETFGKNIGSNEVISIEGKTIKRSVSEHQKPSHVVSAFSGALGICFGQVKVDEKSNEITVIPELLELLDLKGVIVTIDAMGCQTKIAETITQKKSDYLFSLKGNQQTLHNEVKAFFDNELDDEYCKTYTISSFKCDIELDHGRIKKRQYYLCTDLTWLADKKRWANLNGIGMVNSKRGTKSGKQTEETRYFLTSLKEVKAAAKAMRAHWSVENNLHWVLDMIFNEDYSRLRKDNSAENLNAIRKIALNILNTADFSDIIKKPQKKIPLTRKQTLCNKRQDCLLRTLQLL